MRLCFGLLLVLASGLSLTTAPSRADEKADPIKLAAEDLAAMADLPTIQTIDPPEKEFFSKVLDYRGIPIKAHADVTDEALFEARSRLHALLRFQPMALENLV